MTEVLIISAQETVAVCLLVLIAAAVTSVIAVTSIVAVAIAIEVRPLRVIVLTSLRISLAGVNTVLIAVVHGDLIDLTVTVVAIPAVITPIITIAPVVPVIAIATILILRPPLSLNAGAGDDTDAGP